MIHPKGTIKGEKVEISKVFVSLKISREKTGSGWKEALRFGGRGSWSRNGFFERTHAPGNN